MNDLGFFKAKRLITDRHEIRYLQQKLDGHRVRIEKHADGSRRAITRVGTDIWAKIAAFPEWAAAIDALPLRTAIDAEIHAPGVHATSVKTMLNDVDPRLTLTGFALLWFDGEEVDANLDLEVIHGIMVGHGIQIPLTEKIFAEPRSLSADSRDRLVRQALDNGWEGWIGKEAHLRGWYKIKPVHTVDCVVIRPTVSTSALYYGQIRGFRLGLYNEHGRLVEIASTGTGLTAGFKEQIEGREDECIGKVVVVEYDEVASQGRLKFPRIQSADTGWPHFRDDKKPEECVLSQIGQG
jgi:ATP-dependent DNA ligase